MVKNRVGLVLWVLLFPPLLAISASLFARLDWVSGSTHALLYDFSIAAFVIVYFVYVLRKPNLQR